MKVNSIGRARSVILNSVAIDSFITPSSYLCMRTSSLEGKVSLRQGLRRPKRTKRKGKSFNFYYAISDYYIKGFFFRPGKANRNHFLYRWKHFEHWLLEAAGMVRRLFHREKPFGRRICWSNNNKF